MQAGAGRPTGPIVWDLALEIKQYKALGRKIPIWRPKVCPACGEPETLVAHDLRERRREGVFVRRLCCRRRGRKVCGRTVTVLPSCLYPRRHFALERMQPVLEGRFVASPPKSWRELGRGLPVWDSTMIRWCQSFSQNAGRCNEILTAAFASVRGEFALARSLTAAAERTLLFMAALLLEWREKTAAGRELDGKLLLQRLWGWGAQQSNPLFFLSTINAKGRPKGKRLNRGPPDC